MYNGRPRLVWFAERRPLPRAALIEPAKFHHHHHHHHHHHPPTRHRLPILYKNSMSYVFCVRKRRNGGIAAAERLGHSTSYLRIVNIVMYSRYTGQITLTHIHVIVRVCTGHACTRTCVRSVCRQVASAPDLMSDSSQWSRLLDADEYNSGRRIGRRRQTIWRYKRCADYHHDYNAPLQLHLCRTINNDCDGNCARQRLRAGRTSVVIAACTHACTHT